MSTSQPTHEFFEQVQRDHDELRALLGELHTVLAARRAAVVEVTALLDSLVEHIETHFEEEETAGLFEQVSARAPWLSEQVDGLRREHQQLLATVRQLQAAEAHEGGSQAWWQRLEQDFHDFSTDLMHHESSESSLLQQAYSQDIGEAD